MVSPGASLPQVIYEHSIEASYRGEVLTLVNSEIPINMPIFIGIRYWPFQPSRPRVPMDPGSGGF